MRSSKAPKNKKSVKRDLSVTKTCDTCGDEFHPRKNGYELISRFCSAECSREGRASSANFPDFDD
jgi:hypothetical protein